MRTKNLDRIKAQYKKLKTKLPETEEEYYKINMKKDKRRLNSYLKFFHGHSITKIKSDKRVANPLDLKQLMGK